MMGIGFGGIGLLFMLVFWGLLILGVIWIVRALTSSQQTSGHNSNIPSKSAREILDQRYARGEIDREQYEQMKKDLM